MVEHAGAARVRQMVLATGATPFARCSTEQQDSQQDRGVGARDELYGDDRDPPSTPLRGRDF